MALKIVTQESGHNYLMDGDRIVATGSQQMLEAVKNGAIGEYIESQRAEREQRGIGEYSTRGTAQSKRGKK